MKSVVILGGGFAGIAAAKTLQKSTKNVLITLIDREDYHLFTPSLYEVATSEEPQKNIAIPYAEIFDNTIHVVKGTVKNIDTTKKIIMVSPHKEYPYDYLIIALGSEVTYCGIEGVAKHALVLKTLQDAVGIKQIIKEKYHAKMVRNEQMHILVGGGGFSGTELAAELVSYRKSLASHHKKSIDSMQISIIQGSSRLLKELDTNVSTIAQRRLKQKGVHMYFGTHIKSASSTHVVTDDNKAYPYDVFIWTGGVQANSLLQKSGFLVNTKGQIIVNDALQVVGLDSVFAIGDAAAFTNTTHGQIPSIAQVAEDQGKVSAENIARNMQGLSYTIYKYRHFGYIVPLQGHFAVAVLKGFAISGILGWIMQQLIFLYYLLRILSLQKALKRWNKFEMYLFR